MVLGRPRAFDKDKALDQALLVFWEKGYEGTSIADLTGAMGINPPSLYAAFGNKEKLFRQALDRYEERRDALLDEAFAAPTAREAIARLLHGSAERLTEKGCPHGCLMVHGALCGGEDCTGVKRELAARRNAGEKLLRARLQRAQEAGDLPASTDPAALASFITTVLQGMAVKASGGASRKELREIADTALLAFPS